KALLQALSQGSLHQQAKQFLSLHEVAHLTEEIIDRVLKEKAPRPEVHSPDQKTGDVATVPLFPNAAWTNVPQQSEAAPPSKKSMCASLLQEVIDTLDQKTGKIATQRPAETPLAQGLPGQQLWYTWSTNGFGVTSGGFRVRAASRGFMNAQGNVNMQEENF